MTDRSAIEWTQATWNPVTGCDRISPGCHHCYALALARRLKAMGQAKYQTDGRPPTSGPGFGVAVHPRVLGEPLRWRRPRRIFVCSMADLFHARVPEAFIAQVFAVMAATPQHTYQVLTKRPGRMARLLASDAFPEQVYRFTVARYGASSLTWPLPNLWLGTSVEDQRRADQRIPKLLETPAAIRFLSCEPLLGPIDLAPEWVELELQAFGGNGAVCFPRVDWIIAGGESGPGHRPARPDWGPVPARPGRCRRGGVLLQAVGRPHSCCGRPAAGWAHLGPVPPNRPQRDWLVTALQLPGLEQPAGWQVRHGSDLAARALADRHYSRGRPGTPWVGPPGRVLVLVTGDETALWVTHWPRADLAQDGLDARRCSLFRNEGPGRSSALITLAMATTLGWLAEARPDSPWWTVLPADGWVTWVDPRRVASPNPGYCFQRPGWTVTVAGPTGT